MTNKTFEKLYRQIQNWLCYQKGGFTPIDDIVKNIINTELIHQSIMITGSDAVKNKDDTVLTNDMFYSYLQRNYITAQIIDIAKLIDEDRRSKSLLRLWNVFYNQRASYTRENYVSIALYGKAEYGILQFPQVKRHHELFDKLSGKNRVEENKIENGRKDKISNDWIENIQKSADYLEKSQFIEFRNKCIAHNEKNISLRREDVDEAIKHIFVLWNALGILTHSFMFESVIESSITSFKYFDKPLIPEKYINKAKENWNKEGKNLKSLLQKSREIIWKK
jgi:hypothetical protein